MEVGSDLEVVRIAKPASAFLDGRDLGVQTLCHGVGNTMREVGQHIQQVTRDQSGDLYHRFKRLCVAQTVTAALHDACSEYRLTKQAHLVVATPAAYARQLAEQSAKVATGL